MSERGDTDQGFRVVELPRIAPERLSEAAGCYREALGRHAVVCLRFDRPLEDDELPEVTALFGPVKDPIGRTKDGGQLQYSDWRQIIDAGFVMTDEIREKLGDIAFGGLDDERPGLFETFHCDDTFAEEPALATVLHARELPSRGGPTCFLDMRAAYAALDAETRARLAALRVRYAHNNEDAFPPRRAARGPADALVEVSHPLVRRHPVAGTDALFLDLDRAKYIEEMPHEEGRALLQQLQDDSEATAPQCEHHWRDHDVLVWDNASVQHKARGNFAVGEPRRFWRTMVAGPAPAPGGPERP